MKNQKTERQYAESQEEESAMTKWQRMKKNGEMSGNPE